MRHALICFIVALWALPAAAQEPLSGPPADPPAAPAETDKPADTNAPADENASAEINKPPEAVKPIVATDAQRSICLLVEASARALHPEYILETSAAFYASVPDRASGVTLPDVGQTFLSVTKRCTHRFVLCARTVCTDG